MVKYVDEEIIEDGFHQHCEEFLLPIKAPAVKMLSSILTCLPYS